MNDILDQLRRDWPAVLLCAAAFIGWLAVFLGAWVATP